MKSMKVESLIYFGHWWTPVWTPIMWWMPEHTICSIIIQWCNARSCRIRNFESHPFTAGKEWLEGNTCATIEIVKLYKDRKIPKLGKRTSERKLNSYWPSLRRVSIVSVNMNNCFSVEISGKWFSNWNKCGDLRKNFI